jgi:hypothetical protein
MGVYRSMRSGHGRGKRERRAKRFARPRPHRRDEPTGLSFGTVALQQSRLPLIRPDEFNTAGKESPVRFDRGTNAS